jgi:hypothetical protein
MKSSTRKKVFFFFILMAILFLINFWMGRELHPHSPLQYREAFHPEVNANLIILGASHTGHGINPKYFEADHFKVFNFSMDGAGPSFNLKWYEKILQRYYPKPLYVIYGVHWAMFDENILQRRFEQDSRYFPREFLFQEFLSSGGLSNLGRIKTLLLNRFAIFRGRNQLAERLFRGTSDVFVLSRYYNGFIPYERKGGVDKKRDIKPRISEAQIKDFEKLLDEFEKSKIGVIFVQVPGYLPARNASNIEESMQLLNKIAEERKIPFLDYDTERITNINTDPSMFSDWVHLNEKGSDEFSKLLKTDIDSLLKKKMVPNRGLNVKRMLEFFYGEGRWC